VRARQGATERVRSCCFQRSRDSSGAGWGHSDGAARRGARHPQQAQRHREDTGTPSRSVGAVEGPARAASRLRDDGTVGGRKVDRSLRPGRRPKARQELEPDLLGLALQGIAVAQRGRASDLRRLAQEL
jgi:hypothetical protein